jgi:hypothetical protein
MIGSRRFVVAQSLFMSAVLMLCSYAAWNAFISRHPWWALFFTTMFTVLAALSSPNLIHVPREEEDSSYASVRHRPGYHPRRR